MHKTTIVELTCTFSKPSSFNSDRFLKMPANSNGTPVVVIIINYYY